MKRAIACAGVAVSVFFLLCGCGREPTKLGKIDITGAKGLFIAPVAAPKGAGATAKAETVNRMFKITPEGYVLEVTYEDEEGLQTSSAYEPSAVFNVDSTYVMVCFGWDSTRPDDGYLVRKSDGAVFSLEGAGFPISNESDFRNEQFRTYTDESGNVYFYASGEDYGGMATKRIVKLDVQEPQAIAAETYSFDTDSVDYFVVDPKGNAAYAGHTKADSLIEVRRIRKGNGGAYNLPETYLIYLGPDGQVYYQLHEHPDYPIVRVTIDSSYDVSCSDYGPLAESAGSPLSSYKIAFADRVVLVRSAVNKIFEVYNPTNVPRTIDLSTFGLSSVAAAAGSDSYYYLAGQDGTYEPLVVRVDPTDDSSVVWLPANEYDVFKMVVSSADEILFNALRMSDGAVVIGKIDAAGIVDILDATLNAEVTVLERID